MQSYHGVDDRLREWVRERGFSGSVLVTRGARTEFEAGYGMANRSDDVPVRAHTRFGLASATKMFTAVAVSTLVRDGRLSFDTAVVDVLPPTRRPSTLDRNVTIHHLLTHTSGIADYFEEEDASARYRDLWRDRPCYRFLRPADFLPLFGDLEPYRPPGGRLQYSNAGYIVLALVLEELTRSTFADAVTERVFGPAAMASSGFFRADEIVPRLAVGYQPPEQPGDPWRSNLFAIPPVGGGDGGAWSTPRDLDLFLSAFDAGTLTGADVRDLMRTRHVETGEGLAMGYGLWLGEDGRFGHGGADPGVEVLVQRLPREELNVIVLCNMNGCAGEARALVREVALAGP